MINSFIKKIDNIKNNNIDKWLYLNKKRGNYLSLWPNSEYDDDINNMITYISKYYYVFNNNILIKKPGFIINDINNEYFFKIFVIKDNIETEIPIKNIYKKYEKDHIIIDFDYNEPGKGIFKILFTDFNIDYKYEYYIFNIEFIKNYNTIIFRKNPKSITASHLLIKYNIYDLSYGEMQYNVDFEKLYLMDTNKWIDIGNFTEIGRYIEGGYIRYDFIFNYNDEFKPEENRVYAKFKLKFVTKNDSFYSISNDIDTSVYYFASFYLNYNNIYLGNNRVQYTDNRFNWSDFNDYYSGMVLTKFYLYKITIENFNNNLFGEKEFITDILYLGGSYIILDMYALDPNYIYLMTCQYNIDDVNYVTGFFHSPIFRPQYIIDPENLGDIYAYEKKYITLKYKLLDSRYLSSYIERISSLIKNMNIGQVNTSFTYKNYLIDGEYINFNYEVMINTYDIPSNREFKIMYENTDRPYEIIFDYFTTYKYALPIVGCFYISMNIINFIGDEQLAYMSSYYSLYYLYMKDIYFDLFNPCSISNNSTTETEILLNYSNNFDKIYKKDDYYLVEYKGSLNINNNTFNKTWIKYKNKTKEEYLNQTNYLLRFLNVDLIGQSNINLDEDSFTFYIKYYYYDVSNYIVSIHNVCLRGNIILENGEIIYLNIDISRDPEIMENFTGSLKYSMLVFRYFKNISDPRVQYPGIDFSKFDFKIFGDVVVKINNNDYEYNDVLLFTNIIKLKENKSL